MKKNLIAVVLLGALNHAGAAIIYSENFSTAGTMLTAPYDGWTSLSGTGAHLTVSATTGVNMGPTDRDYGSPTFTGVSGTAYYGFDLNVATLPTSGSSYFTGFGDGTAYDGRIFISNTTATSYTIGIALAGNTPTDASSALSLNTTYRIVASYNATSDSMSLWVGSTDVGAPSVTLTGTDASTTFNRIFLRQADAHDNAAASLFIDNLVVSDSFAEAIPEPASALFGAIGLLGMLRRRR